MKKYTKKLLLLMVSALLVGTSAISVMAESSEWNGSCSFNGTKIESSFSSGEIADRVTNLQPGDDVTFTVTYKNDYAEPTDWYMENKILQTLEKASMSNKQVSGTGQAEHGAYTYELIHYDNAGNRTVLFSNREVGGDTVAGGREGLEQATNALEEWFFIETLKQGQEGRVVLNVAFDGETEVNDYMDTNGGLAVRFAVEINKQTTPEPTVTPSPAPGRSTTTTTNAGTSGSVGLTAVKTGDPTNFPLIIGALVAGIVLLIVALRLRKKEKEQAGTEGAETEDEEA